MLVRCFAAPLLLVSIASSLPGQEFTYAPGTSSYRMIVKTSGTSETKGVSRPISLDARQTLTLTISHRAKDTIALAIVLDSAAVAAPELGLSDTSKALGMRVTAMLSPRGQVYSRVLPNLTGREAFVTVAEEMARFLPILPRAPYLGLTWSDTTRDPVPQLGIPITRTRITDYRVTADTVIAGERAWCIERRAQTLMEGAGEMGTPIVFRGTSVGTGAYYIGHTGRYLGAELREQVKSKATLSALGQDVVGEQTQTTRITLLR